MNEYTSDPGYLLAAVIVIAAAVGMVVGSIVAAWGTSAPSTSEHTTPATSNRKSGRKSLCPVCLGAAGRYQFGACSITCDRVQGGVL